MYGAVVFKNQTPVAYYILHASSLDKNLKNKKNVVLFDLTKNKQKKMFQKIISKMKIVNDIPKQETLYKKIRHAIICQALERLLDKKLITYDDIKNDSFLTKVWEQYH